MSTAIDRKKKLGRGLGALMGERVIHVMTHDSIGLGEDGPTHQPVEHVASLRAMPNMTVFRPCDGVEAAECWELALRNDTGPSTLALTRQKVKSARTTHTDENLSAKGGYVLSDAKDAKAVLIATGSEVEIAMAAQAALAEKGVPVRVVSMPSMDLFDQQSESYQAETLGGDLPKVAIEAGVRFGWDRWIGHDGGFVGMSSFGASAPYQDLYNHFNITADAAILTIGGKKWAEMIPIIAGLAIAMPAFALQIVCSPATNAIGRPRIYVTTSAIGAVLFPLCFLFAISGGPMGLVHAWWIAAPTLLAATLALTLPAIQVRFGDLLKELLPVILACGVMASIVYFAKMPIAGWPPIIRLIILAVVGATVYSLTLWFIWPEIVRETWAMLRQKKTAPDPSLTEAL